MSEEQKSARRGRPKSPKGPKGSFTFRLRAPLRAQLEEAAAAADRTLSSELEARLERSFQPEQPAPNPHDFEARVRQIVRSVLDERTGRHNMSVRIDGPLRAGDEVRIPVRPRPQDGWRY